MAYFGRSRKKPQQHGQSTGGRTKSGFEQAREGVSVRTVAVRLRRRVADGRPERVERRGVQARAARSAR